MPGIKIILIEIPKTLPLEQVYRGVFKPISRLENF